MKICPKCNKEHNKPGLYCSRKCANSRTWSKEDKERKSKAALNSEKVKQRVVIKYCKFCGAVKGECKRPDICRKYQLFPSLIQYFGFNEKVIGTEKLYEEFERIKNILIEDYLIDELSTVELGEKHKYVSCGNLNKMLKYLDILARTKSEAVSLAIIKGKLNHSGKYHSCHHLTWKGTNVFLRSSYELNYAEKLDEKKIDYNVESLRIIYWDSQKQQQRMAIPDFYLPETNTIVEVKSTYTLDEQNMRDKVKAYKMGGYEFKLILDKKETPFS